MYQSQVKTKRQDKTAKSVIQAKHHSAAKQSSSAYQLMPNHSVSGQMIGGSIWDANLHNNLHSGQSPLQRYTRVKKEKDPLVLSQSDPVLTKKNKPSNLPLSNNVISRYVKLDQVKETKTTTDDIADKHNLLISDDGTAATGHKESKLLYATAERINEANVALAQEKSPIKLEAASTPKEITLSTNAGFKGQKLTKYEPHWIASNKEPRYRQQKSGKLATLPIDCGRAALAVTGKAKMTLGYDNVDGAGPNPEFQRLDVLAGIKNLSPEAEAELKNAMMEIANADEKGTVIDKAHSENSDKNVTLEWNKWSYNHKTESVNKSNVERKEYTPGELNQEYNRDIESSDKLKYNLADIEKKQDFYTDKAPERLANGLDENVDPEYGQAYSIVGGGNKILWNHHWGGIIMKTDTDNITLENHASLAKNDAWDIRMYGRPKTTLAGREKPKDGQSFHETWKAEKEEKEAAFGDNPTTFRGRLSKTMPKKLLDQSQITALLSSKHKPSP